jgi:hypothetical protein
MKGFAYRGTDTWRVMKRVGRLSPRGATRHSAAPRAGLRMKQAGATDLT